MEGKLTHLLVADDKFYISHINMLSLRNFQIGTIESSEWKICCSTDEKRLDVLINNAGVMQFQK